MIVLLMPWVNAQSASIDWSRVAVDENGEVTFGPKVELDDSGAQEIIERLETNEGQLGFFANADGFYGRESHIEYLAVRRNDEGRLIAIKIVGDANVPRGNPTWRSPPGFLDAPSWRFPIQLNLRDDPKSENGFWWSPGHHHEVELSTDFSSFSVIGPAPSGEVRSHFYAVSEDEASEAARTVEDAP